MSCSEFARCLHRAHSVWLQSYRPDEGPATLLHNPSMRWSDKSQPSASAGMREALTNEKIGTKTRKQESFFSEDVGTLSTAPGAAMTVPKYTPSFHKEETTDPSVAELIAQRLQQLSQARKRTAWLMQHPQAVTKSARPPDKSLFSPDTIRTPIDSIKDTDEFAIVDDHGSLPPSPTTPTDTSDEDGQADTTVTPRTSTPAPTEHTIDTTASVNFSNVGGPPGHREGNSTTSLAIIDSATSPGGVELTDSSLIRSRASGEGGVQANAAMTIATGADRSLIEDFSASNISMQKDVMSALQQVARTLSTVDLEGEPDTENHIPETPKDRAPSYAFVASTTV